MQEFHIGYRSLAEISLEQVSVHIPVYNARGRSLKASLLHATTGGRIANDHGSLTVQALNDISLFIKEGDRVGLIGPNGAGKTTLLKVMAGIYEPIEGKVSISGKVTTLLNANIGVSVEMSGWDNIETRGILLGLDAEKIELLKRDVAENSGLGEFLDMPVRTYSAGMRLRLAFCVSTAIYSEILLLDEGIMAGDAEFLQLARERFDKMLEDANIFVLASHAKHVMRRFCNKGIFMKRGKVICFDDIDIALAAYEDSIAQVT